MREVNSRSLLYTRGVVSGTIDATVYEMTPEEAAVFDVSLDVRRFWLIITVADFVAVLGAGTIPERNDTLSDSDTDVTHRVMPLNQHPVFRYTDHTRREFRIHTIQI